MADLSALTEIILHVKDLPALLAFYRDQLGLAVIVSGDDPAARAELETGACHLVLDASLKPGPANNRTRLVFKVDDLESARDALKARGVRLGPVYSPKAGLTACDGSDPEGNLFTLQSSDAPITTTTIIASVNVPRATSRRMWAV
jgi:catechol 2,3-dioxygenase-like lactoylglutathione lyase family enzyme